MFFKRSQTDNEVSKIKADLVVLVNRIDVLEQNFRSLRGLVNRKIGYLTPQEEEENEVIEKEKVKYTDGFDMFRL